MKSYSTQLFENEVLMEAADAIRQTGAAQKIAEDISESRADREVFELFQASADLMKILKAEMSQAGAEHIRFDLEPRDADCER